MQSRFSDIKFSDNLRFGGYFLKHHFLICYIKLIYLKIVTLCNLVTVLAEMKYVIKSRVHCIVK